MEPITSQPTNQFGFGGDNKCEGHVNGLHMLSNVSEVKFKQQRPKCLELFGCWEYNNKYNVLGQSGETLLSAKEQSECIQRAFCANARAFSMPLMNPQTGEEVIRFERPLKLCSCCFPCCYPSQMQVLYVYEGSRYLGKAIQYPTCFLPHIEVWDEKDNKLYDVNGPCLVCCSDTEYPISDSGGNEVGAITWLWNGCAKQAFTDSDSFGVRFPSGANLQQRALTLGATMLLDFIYFEKQDN